MSSSTFASSRRSWSQRLSESRGDASSGASVSAAIQLPARVDSGYGCHASSLRGGWSSIQRSTSARAPSASPARAAARTSSPYSAWKPPRRVAGSGGAPGSNAGERQSASTDGTGCASRGGASPGTACAQAAGASRARSWRHRATRSAWRYSPGLTRAPPRTRLRAAPPPRRTRARAAPSRARRRPGARGAPRRRAAAGAPRGAPRRRPAGRAAR